MNIVLLRRILGPRRLAGIPPQSDFPYDDMESYPDGAIVDGQNGGVNGSNPVIRWLDSYLGKPVFHDLLAFDDMESYADGATVDGLNGGSAGLTSWLSAYRGVAV